MLIRQAIWVLAEYPPQSLIKVVLAQLSLRSHGMTPSPPLVAGSRSLLSSTPTVPPAPRRIFFLPSPRKAGTSRVMRPLLQTLWPPMLLGQVWTQALMCTRRLTWFLLRVAVEER